MTDLKTLIYTAIVTASLAFPVFGLIVLTSCITLVDIIMGVVVVKKLKEELFDWDRFFDGFFKMFIYAFLISIAYLISKYVVEGTLFDVKLLIPKILAVFFVISEARSIDKKNVRLGKKPTLEAVRDVIKAVKEFRKEFNSIL